MIACNTLGKGTTGKVELYLSAHRLEYHLNKASFLSRNWQEVTEELYYRNQRLSKVKMSIPMITSY